MRHNGRSLKWLSLPLLEERTGLQISSLPYCYRILLENVLWSAHEKDVQADLTPFIERDGRPVPFRPVRILMQDFTGVPCIVDLAALREALASSGTAPQELQPRLPADLVIDHSVQLDQTASPEALAANMRLEMQRNAERYRLLKWSAQAFENLRVYPPGSGICHQLNLEHIATCVRIVDGGSSGEFIRPDTVLGTDSHTTTINALGVLGWGVGGIEAEAVMMGETLHLPLPPVTGVRLVGSLPPEVSATDLALTLTRLLREHKVVGHLVEFFGEGVNTLSLPDRVPAANMAPEYGATTGFFPLDRAAVEYLSATGRDPHLVSLVAEYGRLQRLLREDPAQEPQYDRVVEFDLGKVEPVVAGPRRPHEVVPVNGIGDYFDRLLRLPPSEGGLRREEGAPGVPPGPSTSLRDGDVVIASITSCTNTSSPSLLIAAALLARNAREAGLAVPPHVRTSFTPGSRAAVALLEKLGLMRDLEALGFHACAFGCATCIGNSGPLPEDVARAIRESGVTAVAVLSGNRNFENRIHPLVRANFLCSPEMVVAFALQGHVRSDPLDMPLNTADGSRVRLRDLRPTREQVARLAEQANDPELYRRAYREAESSAEWDSLTAAESDRDGRTARLYPWDPDSTYIRRPPFFDPPPDCRPAAAPCVIRNARCLAVLGDFVTTDHISPAGAIPPDSPAGRYLKDCGVAEKDFNTYGSRRGNHEVMVRGAFSNPRLRNRLTRRPGGWTVHLPSAQEMTIYEAAQRYRAEGVPLIILAGRMYGAGSSRDWAAKGTALLGVRAVIAESFERIHRCNLVEMGVLPLEFCDGATIESLGLSGRELYHLQPPAGEARPAFLQVTATAEDGAVISFRVRVRLDTDRDWDYLSYGGILPLIYCDLSRLSSRR